MDSIDIAQLVEITGFSRDRCMELLYRASSEGIPSHAVLSRAVDLAFEVEEVCQGETIDCCIKSSHAVPSCSFVGHHLRTALTGERWRL